jgi:hypothetical protein
MCRERGMHKVQEFTAVQLISDDITDINNIIQIPTHASPAV